MSDPQVPPYAAPAAPPVPPPPVPTAPYMAPYAAPQHPQFAPFVAAPPPPPRSRTLGVVALVLALVALVVTPIIAGVSSFAVGAAYGVGMLDAFSAATPGATSIEWNLLSPARDLVLWGEIAFWSGTVLGIWAIAQGIVAIVKRRGRGQGIAAIVIAAVAFFMFGVVAFAAFFAGLATTVPLGM